MRGVNRVLANSTVIAWRDLIAARMKEYVAYLLIWNQRIGLAADRFCAMHGTNK
jgi:hypothetical protein